MHKFLINRLNSGGIITNYNCTSKCKHCLYACSPKWNKEYITKDRAKQNFQIVKKMGCYSVHIGGGEPFIDTDSLEMVIREAYQNRIGIDYVETNSSWFTDESTSSRILQDLKKAGLRTLLVSISPFHNEFIPFKKVKGVIDSCQKNGISIFPWIQDFYQDLNSLDDNKTHRLQKYIDIFGKDYLRNIPSRYWVQFSGRALKTFKEIYSLKPLKEIINNSSACSELKDTSHFHIDLYGNYIPGLCVGISINIKDVGKDMSTKEYPIINMLSSNGIKSFYEYAVCNYKFKADNTYLSKCHLCFEIRKHITVRNNIDSVELQPIDFYKNI